MILKHTFPPVHDAFSRILVLGTFPSVKSRETLFYYGHPQNRFWRVLADVFRENVPTSIEEKTALLLRNRVALWDVAGECEIEGSADTSIRRVVPNDIGRILAACPIEHIYANGHTAYALYQKLIYPDTGREIARLPSTSPANCRLSYEALLTAWQVLSP
ncbi:MAG: DNA-deoxyinosine glycosylase [Christensenellales bacterium]|jgi:TDG/mug DNA glycosylase family protein